MSIGTAIFIVGMTALALLVIGSFWLARVLRAETDRMIEDGRRLDAEFEEVSREIREGARPHKGRFEL